MCKIQVHGQLAWVREQDHFVIQIIFYFPNAHLTKPSREGAANIKQKQRQTNKPLCYYTSFRAMVQMLALTDVAVLADVL